MGVELSITGKNSFYNFCKYKKEKMSFSIKTAQFL